MKKKKEKKDELVEEIRNNPTDVELETAREVFTENRASIIARSPMSCLLEIGERSKLTKLLGCCRQEAVFLSSVFQRQ